MDSTLADSRGWGCDRCTMWGIQLSFGMHEFLVKGQETFPVITCEVRNIEMVKRGFF